MRGRRPESPPAGPSMPPGPGHAGDRRLNGSGGFTLIEMTLALALISLIAALALPRGSAADSATALRIKAFEVVALMRADRNAALRSGRTVATTVDLSARLVRSGAGERTVMLPDRYRVRVSAEALDGFRFHPDGSSSGGEMFLVSARAGVAVRVNDLTASVDIAEEGGLGG